jgi:hypothetical protein
MNYLEARFGKGEKTLVERLRSDWTQDIVLVASQAADYIESLEAQCMTWECQYNKNADFHADRIEQLEAELERERLRLAAVGTAALGYFDGCCDEYKSASLDDVLRLRQQLAAHEATIAKLREALDSFEPYDSFESLWSGPEPEVVDSALSLPAPTEHLIAYRDSVLEEAAKVCEEWSGGYSFAKSILGMKEKK